MLSQLDELVDNVPPMEQPSRYGNKAYRTWHEELKKLCPALLSSILPDSWQSSNGETETVTKLRDCLISELSGYLCASFGDRTRIDYGTGHELTFICFLLVLRELRLLHERDYTALVLKIFHRYLDLMRKIQQTYLLEPAGSRGVWGLDDYQFLCFYFGASQLIDHPTIYPKNVVNRTIIRLLKHEYFYLDAIAFIMRMKTGVFAEHSPLLNDITAVPVWKKVKSGLYKMYFDGMC